MNASCLPPPLPLHHISLSHTANHFRRALHVDTTPSSLTANCLPYLCAQLHHLHTLTFPFLIHSLISFMVVVFFYFDYILMHCVLYKIFGIFFLSYFITTIATASRFNGRRCHCTRLVYESDGRVGNANTSWLKWHRSAIAALTDHAQFQYGRSNAKWTTLCCSGRSSCRRRWWRLYEWHSADGIPGA